MEVQMLEKQVFNMCCLRREFTHCQDFFYVCAIGKKQWVVKPNISWKCKYLGWSFLGRPFRDAERKNGRVQFRDLCPLRWGKLVFIVVFCLMTDLRVCNTSFPILWKQWVGNMFYLADSCHFIDLFHLNWEILILLWDLHTEENSEGERDRD